MPSGQAAARSDAPRALALPLVRLILGPGGVIAVDPGDGGFGRGAHVHPHVACLAKAVQRGLARAAKGPVQTVHVASPVASGTAETSDEGASPQTPDATLDPLAVPLTTAQLARAIRRAMDRRVEGLLRTAIRTRSTAIGADAVSGACARGEAALVLVASDAAAGADLPEVRRAIAAGRAAAWGTKQALGAIAGGRREQGVAILAITSGRLAGAIAEAVGIADAVAAAERGATGGAPTNGSSKPGATGVRREKVAEPGPTVRHPVVNGAARRRARGWVRRIGC